MTNRYVFRMPRFRVVSVAAVSTVLVAGALVVAPASVAKKTGAFSDTGSMVAGTLFASQSLLNDGRVLVAGGYVDDDTSVSSAEIYDPSSGVFTATGSMNVPRQELTSTLLNDGRVLIAGGTTEKVAEVYDPATGSFTLTGSMADARADHTASLLADGRVLIAGGATPGTGEVLRSAEIYDPVAGTFAATAPMSVPRVTHTASALDDGTVLMAGGYSESGTRTDPVPATASAELYDTEKDTFVATDSMSTPRALHSAQVLRDGTALVMGGLNAQEGLSQKSAEIYKPGKGKFVQVGSMKLGRYEPLTAVNGYQGQTYVVVAGGLTGSNGIYETTSAAEAYNPYDQKFRKVGSLSHDRVGHASTALRGSQTLMAGGATYPSDSNTAELYTPVVGPGIVQDPKKTDVMSTRATVTWKKAKRNGGAKVTKYESRIKKKGKSWQEWKSQKKKKLKVSGSSKYSKTFKNLKKGKKLKPNTTYVVEVRGKNDAGAGPYQRLKFRTRS